MSSATRGKVELLCADGSVLSCWLTFALRQSFVDPLGSFSFTASPVLSQRQHYRSLLAKGERVQLTINGARQATALITTVDEEIGEDGYMLSVEAKSPLCTPYEGAVNPFMSRLFTADTPMVNVVLDVLGDYGFSLVHADTEADVTAISGKSLSGRAPPVVLTELEHKDVQAAQGETAYAFCARLFSRVGLILRCDNAGDLLLGAPDYGQRPAYSLVQERSGTRSGDRMLRSPSISIRSTNDGQHSEIIVLGKAPDARGQTNVSMPVAGVAIEGATGLSGGKANRPAGCPFETAKLKVLESGRHTYYSTAAPFKPRYYTDKRSRDVAWAQSFAEIMHGAQALNAWQLRCSVDGLISLSGGRVWAVDTVGHVYCEDLEVDDDLWLLETVKTGSRQGGQMTKLTWIPLNSLRLGG